LSKSKTYYNKGRLWAVRHCGTRSGFAVLSFDKLKTVTEGWRRR